MEIMDNLTILLNIAREWPPEHLDDYIKRLDEQVKNTNELIRELKLIQRQKKRKLKDSGPRGAT